MTGHYFNLNTLILILLTGQNYGPRFCFECKLIFNMNDIVSLSLFLARERGNCSKANEAFYKNCFSESHVGFVLNL